VNLEIRFFGSDIARKNIFHKVGALAKNSENKVTVTGTIAGFDMPIMGNCQRGFVLNVSDENGIEQED